MNDIFNRLSLALLVSATIFLICGRNSEGVNERRYKRAALVLFISSVLVFIVN